MFKSIFFFGFLFSSSLTFSQPAPEGYKYQDDENTYLYDFENGKIRYYTMDTIPIFDKTFENVSAFDLNGYAWAENDGATYKINIQEKKQVLIPQELEFLIDKNKISIYSSNTKNIYFPLKEGFYMDLNGKLISANTQVISIGKRNGLQDDFQYYLSDVELETLDLTEQIRISSIKKHLKNKGIWIIEPGTYSNIEILEYLNEIESFYRVKKNSKLGVISSTGDTILPCEFSEIDLIQTETYSEYLSFLRVKNKKYGIYSCEGKQVIQCEYDAIEMESANYISNGNLPGFTVQKGKNSGFISLEGLLMIPAIYSYVDSYFTTIDTDLNFEKIPTSSKKVTSDFYPYSFYGIGVTKKNTMDFYSPKGEFLNQISVDYFDEISELGYITFQLGEKIGLIGKGACLKIPATKDNITLLTRKDELLIFCEEELESGDFKTELLGEDLKPYFEKDIQSKFISIDQLVVVENDKYGIVDLSESSKTNVVWSINPQYDFVYPISSQLWTAKLNNKYGVVNTENEIIIPVDYDVINSIEHENFRAEKAGKYTIFNSSGEMQSTRTFEDVSFVIPRSNFSSSIYVVKDNQKWYFFDPSVNNYIGNIAADKIERNNYQSYKLTIDGKQMLVDLNLNILIPLNYTSIKLNLKKYEYECILPNGKKEFYNLDYKLITSKK